MTSSDLSPYAVGQRVAERGYEHNQGVVTGHAPDGWTFVKWDISLSDSSYPPCKLVAVDLDGRIG